MPCRIHRNVRSVALALVLLVLMSGAVQARPLAVHPAPVSYFQAVWQWVMSYAPAWAKAGGEMDPDGARRTLVAPRPSPDAGSEMDPNG